MPKERPSWTVDLEQAERLMWWGSALCFIALGILLYGEFTGWWNDAGEIAITVVTVLGTLLAAIAILMNATRSQAAAIATGVGHNGNKLDTIFEATASNGRKLDTISEATASNGRKLETLHDDMGSLKEGQEEQTEVLVEIRDRL